MTNPSNGRSGPSKQGVIQPVPPVVHPNGTPRRVLLATRFEAIDALYEAGDALGKAAPNNRDYYPAGPEACERAQAQHDERIRVLRSLIDALHAEIRELTA